MKSNSNILIFSAPIQSGKTTLLMKWLRSQKNVRGILTPETNGKRKLYDINSKAYYNLEGDHTIATDEKISVGRFHFYKVAFDQAQHILLESVKQNPEWLIVDEVGKLELYQQNGLEPAVAQLIDHYKNINNTGKLLLIIRDTLLNECIEHYGLQEATIVNKDFFSAELNNDLYGLVVCGGESKRMGMDKSLIDYHGKPQRYYLVELLQLFCEKVFISCNKTQALEMAEGYETIMDAPQYQNIGPMAALLSAFEKYPNKSFLAIGCDYPFIGNQEIKTLIEARDQNEMSVCYHNSQSIAEPLLALYEKETFSLLKNNFSQQKYSLRHFLEQTNTKRLNTTSEKTTSVDTTEDYLSVLNKIKQQSF